MNEIIFIKYLVNEIARNQINVTKEVYQEIKDYIISQDGQLAYERFLRSQCFIDLANKRNKYTGYHSTMKNLSDSAREEFKK